MQQKITPNLWFDFEAEEAASFYISVFENSRIVSVTHYPEGAPGPAGTVMTVEFELDGQRFVGINGGPQFTFDEAVSFGITCETQDEIDYYWERLSEGGEESQCGWLKDRYGLSWQVVPTGMEEVLNDPDPERAERAMQAMLGMSKPDIAALRRAPTASRRADRPRRGSRAVAGRAFHAKRRIATSTLRAGRCSSVVTRVVSAARSAMDGARVRGRELRMPAARLRAESEEVEG